MRATGFTHLHLHSQYSLLDGAIRMDDLVPTIKAKGMSSVAVTDHGNMFGAVHFYKNAKKHGIKPILGCEAYVAGDKGRKDRSERSSAHLILLAKDNEGYKNLSYLISMGFMEGFYYNPRIDKELLKKHSKGLIGLSACLGGVVNKTLLREGEARAAEEAVAFRDLFEPGHFFLEVQDNGYDVQETSNTFLQNLSELYNIPLVATADSHYLTPEDSPAHEILMCIGQSRSLQDFRAKMDHSDKLYVRGPEEMWAAFERTVPQAVENTMRISDMCNVELNLSETYLPNYGVPQGMTREDYLAQVTVEGLKRRIKESHYPIHEPAYRQRLDYELGVIQKMGFAGYFLIVWDFIRYAKESTIPVGPGRGSGAGSLVAWCLRITDLDPIPYDLIFERFLNPERVSMPDFDIDFCQDRRNEVINYVGQRYGRDNVGQIVTYSALSAKSVIKDVGRVMGVPFAEINAITKLIPGLVNGKKVSIDQALEIEPKLREIQQEKPVYKDIIEISRRLEGLNRQTGMHAAGIVIGDKPLWEYVPVCRGKEGEIVTQFAKDEVEEAGLVKFDFLGLKTLTVIANAVKHVRRKAGSNPMGPNTEFDIERVPLDDANVYALITSGNTDGVFQLESSGFKELLKRLKPDCFEDVVAAVALYRPGPLDAGMVDDYIARKHGKRQVTYPHPVCEPILRPTYGVIVYQEQVMRIAVDLCGFSMGQADVLRKAMGKKKADVMAEMRARFVGGAHEKNGMDKQAAEDLFTQIEKFAGYAFNKSHSAAYAVISYHTAYLKHYFPVEFMAALLSTEMRDQDTVVRYIQSGREKGISILPPDLQRSDKDFSVVYDNDGASHILFGLGAVKGVGDAAVDSVLKARKERQEAEKSTGRSVFGSIYGFCEQVDTKPINKKVLEALVKSGAMDCMQRPRSQLFEVIERALEAGQAAQKDRASGQTSLFDVFAGGGDSGATGAGAGAGTGAGDGRGAEDAGPPLDGDGLGAVHGAAAHSTVQEWYPELPEWPQKQKLAHEKEALGFYITGHPLAQYARDLPRLCNATTATLAKIASSQQRFTEVRIGGVVGAMRERPLKSGNGRMAFLTLEDLNGSVEVLVFSRVFAETEHVFKGDEPILVTGSAVVEGDEQGAVVKVRASAIGLLSEARAQQARELTLRVPAARLDADGLEMLKGLLRTHRGKVPVALKIEQEDAFVATVQLPPHLRVQPTDELLELLQRELAGCEAVLA